MYEFNDNENQTLSSAATWSMVVAILLILAGTLSLCGLSFVRSIGYIAMGVFLLLGANSLRTVVNTQGNDIKHVMDAVDALGRSLLVRSILAVLMVLWMIGVNLFLVIATL